MLQVEVVGEKRVYEVLDERPLVQWHVAFVHDVPLERRDVKDDLVRKIEFRRSYGIRAPAIRKHRPIEPDRKVVVPHGELRVRDVAWRETVEQWKWYQQLAQGVVQGDLPAYQAVIDNLSPFEELENIGAKVRVRIVDHSLVEAFTTVRNDVVHPVEHKLLASGRLSSKDMPKTKYWAIYQDHVCSAAIRVARELFHLLPIARTYVHVATVMLNTATGHSGAETVLSVEFDRERLLGLNFERIDASDAVESFRHAMNFKKTAGFSPVEILQPLAQLTSLSNETPISRRR